MKNYRPINEYIRRASLEENIEPFHNETGPVNWTPELVVVALITAAIGLAIGLTLLLDYVTLITDYAI